MLAKYEQGRGAYDHQGNIVELVGPVCLSVERDRGAEHHSAGSKSRDGRNQAHPQPKLRCSACRPPLPAKPVNIHFIVASSEEVCTPMVASPNPIGRGLCLSWFSRSVTSKMPGEQGSDGVTPTQSRQALNARKIGLVGLKGID
jgi:hypothetical protein